MAENYGYSNGLTYNFIIQKISDDEPYEKKRLYISQAIKKISNTDLLNNIIFKLAETGLVDLNDEVVLKFRKELVERNYTEDINTKIRADFLSVFLDYDTKANYFQRVTKQEKPKLNIKIRRKQLFHNCDDVSKYLKKQMALFQEKEISKLPFDQQENAYKKIIKETTLFHYTKDSKEFKKELKLFKLLKNNISPDAENLESNTERKKYRKWYILIKPLVSGEISNIQKKSNQELTKTQLSKLIIKNLQLDVDVNDIAPYIQYSFIDNQENNPKNLFSKKKVIEIYKYCNSNDVEIIDAVFLLKVKKYIDL